MKIRFTIAFNILLMATMLLIATSWDSAFAMDPAARVMGNYEGFFSNIKGEKKPMTAQIIAEGGKHHLFHRISYKAVLHISDTPILFTANGASRRHGNPDFKGRSPLGPLEGEIVNNVLSGSILDAGTFKLDRIERKPPTLGMTPPHGSSILFSGKNLDAWLPTETPWMILADGTMEARKGNLVSKQGLGSGTIHVEFCTPFMPEERGQDRGNSGVYVQGRYEIQVLDSFGLAPKDTECGGIYKQAAPKVNACLPPTEWQTYDIAFQAPQYDVVHNKTRNAHITVIQNGITIHNDLELARPTPGGISDKESKSGPLMLQDHDCKVQYRNIWYAPAP